jgi:polysaccharide pyruvyl transferase WcaK-like protein/glycosyltransferase involved in cell wall biosynthesis
MMPASPKEATIRLLAIGDIGSTDAYHVGDEAMTLGLIRGVAGCGVDAEWTVMSAQPDWSSARFGVRAVPRLTFSDCAGPAEREQRLAQLDAILAEPSDRWPLIAPPLWRESLAAIGGSDAIVLAGGGNLCRTWPEHAFERAAVVRAARRAARPVAITGQTIGPALDERTRDLVTEVLSGCVFVGVREAPSHGLALELGVPPERAILQFDDAIGLDGLAPDRGPEIVGDGPFIAVTLNGIDYAADPALVPQLAAQLAELGRQTAAAVVLVPHVGDVDGAEGHDVAMGRALIAAAGDSSSLRMAPLPSPEEAVWYCRHAQLVVSTRYHPVVFATAAGTPVLFLFQDRYTLVKGQGALALAGLEGWTLAWGLAASGLLVPAALELWRRREAVRRHLQRLAPTIATSRRQHVAALLSALVPARAPHATVEPIIHRRGPSPEGDWVERAHDGLAGHIAEARWQAEREAMARQLARADTRIPSPQADRQGNGVVAACTIVARNYLPYARAFARSLVAVHPEAQATVLVIDGAADPADEGLFRSLRLEDVIPDAAERQRLALMYDVTELSTAVKPLLLRRLLAEGTPSVLFFDPDIQVFDSVAGLSQLAIDRDIVLTPHVLAPIPDDGFEVSDLAVLRAGVFNLGFIGVGAGAERFLEWWSARLRRHCLSDVANGMFVDQRWVDCVAGSFPHAVVSDPGCNVAYWNLHERRVVRTATGYDVNGVPLRFYHFSGFDPEVPHLLSKHQGPNPRILLSEHPAVMVLCDEYAAKLRADGHAPAAASYGFSTLPDGTPIDMVMRRLYRWAVLDAERLGQPLPPSAWDEVLPWLNAPDPDAPRLSRYLFGLRQKRPDIQRIFQRPYGADADAYVHWARFDPRANETIPASLRPDGSPAPFAIRGPLTRPPMPRDGGDDRAPFPTGLNVAGYFKAELGTGEVARLVVSAARAGGIPVVTVTNGQTLSRQEEGFEMAPRGGAHPVTLICSNADEFPRAVDALPREMIEDCHRIGFWFWETEQLPSAYRSASDLLDEVWVASEYVAAAVRTTVSKPVHVCPLPLRCPDPAPASRADMGLPEGFVFLFMFDFLSNIHRKNPIGLVEAFCRAFPLGGGPTLMLKSINGHLSRGPFEAVRAAVGGRPDVVVMDRYLPARERDALMNACDCYVSLHRSEGFGLTLAEAMALEKPAIATAYSGNLAFMTEENSFLVPYRPGQVPSGCEPYPKGDGWAEPDLDAAASLMRQVYEHPVLARDRGRLARAYVLDRLSPDRTVSFIRQRLSDITTARRSPEPEPVPAHESDLAAEPDHVPPSETTSMPPPPEPVIAVAEPALPPSAPVDLLAEHLELAQRDALEAELMLVTGIPFRTSSRFGWLGQLLRTAVLRLLRPYANFATRAHRQHLQSTMRVLEYLRRLDAEIAPLRGARRGGDRGSDAP